MHSLLHSRHETPFPFPPRPPQRDQSNPQLPLHSHANSANHSEKEGSINPSFVIVIVVVAVIVFSYLTEEWLAKKTANLVGIIMQEPFSSKRRSNMSKKVEFYLPFLVK